jgi:hypothetical protein
MSLQLHTEYFAVVVLEQKKAENFASWIKRQENFVESCAYKFRALSKDVHAKSMYFRNTYGRSFE